jgi:hypothetical protein
MPNEIREQKTDKAYDIYKNELTDRGSFLECRGGKHFSRLAGIIIWHGAKFAAKISD